jgi:osmotically-inducible protein OsmY
MGTYRDRENYRDANYGDQDDLFETKGEQFRRDNSRRESLYGREEMGYGSRSYRGDRERDRGISGLSPGFSRRIDQEPYFGGSRGSGFGRGYADDTSEFGLRDSSYGGRGGYGGGYGSRRTGGYDYDADREFTLGSDYPTSERGFRGSERGSDRGWWDKTTDEVASWFGDEEAERRREQDERLARHRGRGPRNYTRSDDRIREDLNDRLTDNPYLDASDIEVEVLNGEVTLTGTVDSRWAKRMAEDIAEDVSGVRNVENRIRYSSRGSYQHTSMPDRTDGASTSDNPTSPKSKSASANR